MENSSKENIKFENTELYKFLKVVCNNGVTSKCGSNEILDAEKWLNSNKNKNKITSIVNYIVSLKFDGYKNLISTGAFCGFKNLSCDLKFKTYSILCLINSGVNPFDIQKCLESNHNTGFNWNNFSNSIENYKGDWYRVKGELISVAKAVMVVEFMNIFKSLLNSQEHTEAVDTSFEANAIDSYVCYFENEFEDAILRFIGFYLLDQKGFSAEYTKVLLGIPDGFVFKYFLAKETKLRLKNLDKNQLDLCDLIYGYSSIDSNRIVSLQDDFCNLVNKLNPVLVCVVALILMRNISFTDEQMNVIASKVKNNSVMTILRQINQSLHYKKYNADMWECNGINCRRVKFGPITHALDYVFLKIFRGIGYLGAILWALVHFIPYALAATGIGFVCAYMNAICAGLLYFIPFWSTFAIFSGFFLFIFTVIYVIRHFFETQLFFWRAEICSFRDWWSGEITVVFLNQKQKLSLQNNMVIPN